MAFLDPTELKTVAPQEVLNLITGQDDSIAATIISESIDLMKSYLYGAFDTEAIFSKTGAERSLIVLKFLKDIVIHEIYIRRSRSANEVTQARYNEALLWLEKVAEGKITPALPLKAKGMPPGGTFLKLGANANYPNKF